MSDKTIPDYAKKFIDPATFCQILEMDDDGDNNFSKTIVFEFFSQAETTFTQMEDKIEKRDLLQLSSLGHFLKGSSATLGLIKLKEACEKIQNLGAGLDASGAGKITDSARSLDEIEKTLEVMKQDYDQVSEFLKSFYGDFE